MALNQNTCPVCGKAGISDFRNEAVVCPQCDSDLKAFLLLNRLGSGAQKPGRYMPFVVIAALILITGGAIVKYLEATRTANWQAASLLFYEDSLKTLKTKPSVLVSSVPTTVKRDSVGHAYFVYRVKKGDFTMRIARLFYNDWRRYKEIEQDNNLVEPYHLHKGDALKIRINQ